MVRRPKVMRHSDGTPLLADRCKAEVVDKDELFPRQCLKARLRGLAFCEIHRNTTQLKVWSVAAAASYDDVVDAAAVRLIETLDRLPIRGKVVSQ